MKKMRLKRRSESGFTLIEMLLVMVIMGIMLAVIVPRAWRANVDAKYTLCRQNCTELAKYAQEWCESMLLAQDDTVDTATINDYYLSLKRNTAGAKYAFPIAFPDKQNWNNLGDTRYSVSGRDSDPETTVQSIMPQDKVMRNPFNGSNIFSKANDMWSLKSVVPGSIGFTGLVDASKYMNYSLLFQGSDSTTYKEGLNTTYHAGMGPETIGNVRNGIFVARVR